MDLENNLLPLDELNLRLDALIDFALSEDLGDVGDVTSLAIFDSQNDSFYLLAKDEGVFCGKEVIGKVCKKVDESIQFDCKKNDGDKIEKGDLIATFSGKVLSILQAERTIINFIGFLSGIATASFKLVSQSGNVTILDTRKTLPGYRLLSKYAVLCGKASNHRIGLYDMVLIKDNHIDASGSITNAVSAVRAKWGTKYKIEVETRDLSEVLEALNCGVDRIMLDNMSDEVMKQAVEIIGGRCETEASGNMNIDRLASVGECGVDFVSFGSITHSVKTFDFSLKQGTYCEK